ncbi:hypothetical protein [Methanoregula boonei]|uniref:hypothetical protein n=1 Tax=Methanoregula boonei TaxID=358766 RepID=UPI0012F91FFD|nr:hypothetical protein [Methanoregula boonei]
MVCRKYRHAPLSPTLLKSRKNPLYYDEVRYELSLPRLCDFSPGAKGEEGSGSADYQISGNSGYVRSIFRSAATL